MKISSFSAARSTRSGAVAASASAFASVVMLGLLLQTTPAQAQPSVPAPNGDNTRQWVAIDDQIVPATWVAGSQARRKPNGLSFHGGVRKWPNGRVAYTYAANMNDSKKAVFESACREWEKHANLHFSPRAAEANYIVVTSTADVSNSAIGMSGGGQNMNLADWANKITAVHELAHALGIIHEQSRPDRDTYVTIHPENIVDGMSHNFFKVENALNQGPYDFDSMMHYYSTAFSKNGKDTITANPGYTEFQNRFGQQNHLSEGDKIGMARIYGPPGSNARGIIKPEAPKTKDILTAKPTGKGTPDSYSYVWSKNGEEIEGETSHTLDLSVDGNGDKEDFISVEITGPDEAGVAGSETAAVTILNSAPKVTPTDPETPLQTLNTQSLNAQLTGSDDDGDALTFLKIINPEHGNLAVQADGSFTYTPDGSFLGTDGFKVAANDGQTVGLPTTFTIDIARDNQAPVIPAENTNLSLIMGFSVSASLGATDPDGDSIRYSLTEGNLPAGLSLSRDGILSGTPTEVGRTSATLVIRDNRGATTTVTLNIEVKIDDRAPSVKATISPAAPQTNDIVVVKAVVNNQTAGAVSVVYNFKVNGKLVQSGPSNTLNLAQRGRGDKNDYILCEVTATNEGGRKDVAIVRTRVFNSAPIISDGSGRVAAGTLATFWIFARDVDNDAISLNIVGKPKNGTATISKHESGRYILSYRSNPKFNGSEVIRMTASDGRATSKVATFNLQVTGGASGAAKSGASRSGATAPSASGS